MLLDECDASLNDTLSELETFYTLSCLKSDYDKTNIVYIDSKKCTVQSIKIKWKFDWENNISKY